MFKDTFKIPPEDFETPLAKRDSSCYDELSVYGNGLRETLRFPDEEAAELFSIIKSADNLEGFSLKGTKYNSFGKLCQEVKKHKQTPSPAGCSHKNPWDDSCSGNVLETLGIYGLESRDGTIFPYIKLDPDEIEYTKGVVVLTLFHELMHAAMDVGEDICKLECSDVYWYYKEEAYANAFALKLLKASEHEDWYNEAYDFVKKQPSGYNAGAMLVDEPISMEDWRKEKSRPADMSKEDIYLWMSQYIENDR